MSETVIPLRLTIDTGDAVDAASDLDRLSSAAHSSEDAFERLGDAAKHTGDVVEGEVTKPVGKARDEFGRFIKSTEQAGDTVRRTGDKARSAAGDFKQLEKDVGKLAFQFGALVGGAVALDRIKDFFGAARKAAEESAQVWSQVAQGIESTGGAARRSMSDIQALATQIQNMTLFDDETVAFGAANLLTFTNIAEEAFDRVLFASADVSQRVGQDFKSTIIQLGKALNDPIANLWALSRTGIKFSETQKEQIKNLVQQNKLFEAQSIILTEIEKQYGGSAKAVRNAAGGAKAASNAFGDFLEAVGGPIIEQTNDDFETLAKLLNNEQTQESARALGQFIADGMEAALKALQGFISKFNEFVAYLKSKGIIEDIPIEISFDLVGPNVDATQLRKQLLDGEEVLRIGIEINNEQVAQVQERLKQIEIQKAKLERSIIVNEQAPNSLNAVKSITGAKDEIAELNTEFKNLYAILQANAEATGGIIAGIEEVGKVSAQAGEGVAYFNTGLEEQIANLERLAAATLQGGKAVQDLQKELQLQAELKKLEDAAAKAGEQFDRARAEQHLREMQRLGEVITRNEEYLALVQQITRTGAEGVQVRLDEFNKSVNTDTQDTLLSSNQFQRAASIGSFRDQIKALREGLLEIADELDKETFDSLFAAVNASAAEFEQKVVDSADYLADAITESADQLVTSLLEDLFFNGGKGVGDILNAEARRDIKDALIDPLSDFLTGQSDDLLGDIISGAERVADKYEKIGSKFDELFGTGSVFAEAFAGAGAGFAGFKAGSGAADIFNGSQGETGGKVGGAVGGGIGFAVGGPIGAFIGSAAGGFLGDIFGGLFGRKTAQATVDLLTGNVSDAKDSKKDSRNERRDTVLQGVHDAISALADILGADIRNLAVQVKAGKSSISLDFVDPRTGRVVQSAGSVDDKDVQGAIDRVLQLGIDNLITGGDELLKTIARGLSAANVPSDLLLESLSDIAGALEITKEKSSPFLDALEEISSAFDKATLVAGTYAGALTDLHTAELKALQALATEADKTLDEQLRRIKNPISQDAIDLADEQALRLREITELNAQLAEAAAAVGGGQSALEAADAQERLTKLIELNTAEWEQFIQNAASSPEAFQAAADAIDYLKSTTADLPIAFEQLGEFLENARISLVTAFEGAQQDRLESLTDPVRSTFRKELEAQLKLIQSAQQLGGTQQEIDDRVALVVAGNTEALKQLILQSGNSADNLEAAVAALEDLVDEIAATGANMAALQQTVATAQQALRDQTDQQTIDRILNLVSTPASELKKILERQRGDVDVATRIGADVGLVQRANFIEIQNFLKGLSDEDLAGLGDLFGQITEAVGRLPVALLELDDAFDRFVNNRQDEIQRLESLARDAGSAKDRASDLIDDTRRRFGGLTPLDQFEQSAGDFYKQVGLAQDTSLSDEARIEAVQAGEEQFSAFLNSITGAFGGSAEAAAQRDRALGALEIFKVVSAGIETESVTLSEALDREYDVLVQIRDKISSADTDLVPFIQSALATGQISGSPQEIRDLLSEVVQLTLVQDQNRRDLIDSIRDAAVSGFSNGVSITGTVAIDDTRLHAVMVAVLDKLTQIETNQTTSGTLSRLGVVVSV